MYQCTVFLPPTSFSKNNTLSRLLNKTHCAFVYKPQVKEEGWYLVAGDVDTHELLALRRISVEERSSNVRLHVPRYNGAGQEMAHVTLFLMSDSYPGLDQQVDIPLSTSVGKLEQGRRGGRQNWGVPMPMLSVSELWGSSGKAGKKKRESRKAQQHADSADEGGGVGSDVEGGEVGAGKPARGGRGRAI